ncbi:MAG: hypothetical protein R2816_09185 [Flavobacteriaceae bacterium]|nr:hypothetical protein [Flavobacteriaceae bacterium]
MNKHYCKVGKITPNLNKIISLKELENKITNFVDDLSKLDQQQDWKTSF